MSRQYKIPCPPFDVQVPLLATCRVLQLIVEGERRRGNPACLAAEP